MISTRVCAVALMLMLAASVPYTVAQDDEAATEEAVPEAHIIAYKSLHTGSDTQNYIVAGVDFTVEYSLHNAGSVEATNVRFSDEWPVEHFTIVDGNAEGEWATLAAGATVSQNVTLRAQQPGTYKSGQATVRYEFSSGEDEPEQRTAASAGFGDVQMVTIEDHELAIATYAREWTTFFVLAAIPIAAPYVSWTLARGSKGKSA